MSLYSTAVRSPKASSRRLRLLGSTLRLLVWFYRLLWAGAKLTTSEA